MNYFILFETRERKNGVICLKCSYYGLRKCGELTEKVRQTGNGKYWCKENWKNVLKTRTKKNDQWLDSKYIDHWWLAMC